MILSELYKSNKEEYWNVITHGVPIPLAIGCFFYLLLQTSPGEDNLEYIGVLLFGLSSILVYLFSMLYHYHWNKPYRSVLRTVDHISIFYLIAGSYSPFTLIVFEPEAGWRLFVLVWGLAFLGTIFKFFFTGKYENLSLFLYVALGWLVLIEYDAFLVATAGSTLSLLMAGGILYCIGVLFYVKDSLRYNHAIWHVFVVAANFCHFLAVDKLV